MSQNLPTIKYQPPSSRYPKKFGGDLQKRDATRERHPVPNPAQTSQHPSPKPAAHPPLNPISQGSPPAGYTSSATSLRFRFRIPCGPVIRTSRVPFSGPLAPTIMRDTQLLPDRRCCRCRCYRYHLELHGPRAPRQTRRFDHVPTLCSLPSVQSPARPRST